MADETKRLPAGTDVLLVEDEFLIALDLEHLLLERGARSVRVAHSLTTARQMLSATPSLGIAILDVKLRDGSGLELLDELRDRDIGVVLTTGLASMDAPGALELVAKPYAIEELIAAVERVLAGRRQSKPGCQIS